MMKGNLIGNPLPSQLLAGWPSILGKIPRPGGTAACQISKGEAAAAEILTTGLLHINELRSLYTVYKKASPADFHSIQIFLNHRTANSCKRDFIQ
jgi:hypothetical protein